MNISREFSRPVRIGSGSFSTVFRVFEQKLERNVVVKHLKFNGEKERLRIEHEIHVLSSMQLPCVPHIYDVIRRRKQIIIVMEWIRGVPLSALPEHMLTPDSQLLVAEAIITSLALLHKNSIAHGDLKPENILITSDLKIYLVDFGFSRLYRSEGKTPGVIQGTPAYMAPELWDSHNTIDYRKVDLYALGILLSRLMGNTMPASVAVLTEVDPDLRPADCATFEKTWRLAFNHVNSVPLTFYTAVRSVVEEYTARLLLTGARKLHSRARSQEAYALLTESLDIWPDNTDALQFLQNKFSTPIKPENKNLFFAVASVGAIVLAIVSAYFIGKQASVSGDILGNLSLQQEEKRLIIPLSLFHENRLFQPAPVVLRQIAGGMNLTGTLQIEKIVNRGMFIIDSRPIEDCGTGGVSLLLDAGTHRVEWFDSTAQRRFSEIVEVLPFEKKTVSLKRFLHGKSK